jgi:UDP-N-acetylmuramate dehydrogenase
MFSYRNSEFKSTGAGRWLIVSVSLELRREGWEAKLDYPDLKHDTKLSYLDIKSLKPRDFYEAVCRIRPAQTTRSPYRWERWELLKNPVISSEQFLQLKGQYTDLKAYAESGGSQSWLQLD